MRRIFVDTSVWLALRDPRHPQHPAVVAWLEGVKGRLVTSSDIVDETITWANRRWGHPIAVGLGEHIMDPDEVQLVHIEETLFRAGWERFQARRDKGYSLTDCTSFVVMERMAIETAATLDKHFRQEGFQVVPEQ